MRKINMNYSNEQRLEELKKEWELKGETVSGWAAHYSYFYCEKGLEVGPVYAESEYVILTEYPSVSREFIPQYNGSMVWVDRYKWNGSNVSLTFPDMIDTDITPLYRDIVKLAVEIARYDKFELTVHGATCASAYLLVDRGWRKKKKFIYKETMVPQEWMNKFIELR